MGSAYPPGPERQNSNFYQRYPNQPGGPPPPPQSSIGVGGSAATPRQMYPGVSQPMYAGVPSTGPSQTNISSSDGYVSQRRPQGQFASVGQGGGYNYRPPPPSGSVSVTSGPPPSRTGSGGLLGAPPTTSSQTQPDRLGARISPTPPTSVATMTTGVGQMQLGPPPTGT